MLTVFSPIFVADIKIIFDYNFRAPLKPDFYFFKYFFRFLLVHQGILITNVMFYLWKKTKCNKELSVKIILIGMIEAATRGVLWKKVFLEISQNSL